MSKGIIDRFRAMNIGSTAVLSGQLFAAVLRNGLRIVVMLSTAFIIGFKPHADWIDWLA